MSETSIQGWSVRSVGSGTDILSGFPFKSDRFSDDASHIGLIRIRDLKKQRLETFYNGSYDELFRVKRGDVLIGMDGDFSIVKWASDEALLNQRICKIAPNSKSSFCLDYLYHDLQNELLLIHEKTGATTVKHLSIKDIRGIEKPFPPLPEQKKIAAILTSVDDVIENTQAQIAKLQDLKKATMNELLTKGIGHTEFKDSELGRIPESWNIVKVGDLAEVIDPQPDHRTPPAVDHGVPYIGLGDIQKNGDIDFNNARKVSKEAFEKQLRSFDIHNGAFIFGKIGTIGQPSVLPENRFFCLSANIILITSKDYQTQQFLYQIFMSNVVDKQIADETNTTSQPALGIKKVRDFLIPLPDEKERTAILSALTAIDVNTETKQRKLNDIRLIKKALMNDLLTGKVRVNVN
tara:strand:- start:9882 stop:11099 length:1218 start_codon:yes stop_codon:yes gene_type:complete